MKNRPTLLSILLVLMIALPLFSSSYSPRTINIHSPLYEEVDLLYRLHGLALPSGARPWSTNEAALILSAIPDGGSTAKLKQVALSRLETTLPKQDSNGLSHRFSTTVALETYAHSNSDGFTLPQDWSYNADRRLPLFDFRLEMDWNNRLYFATSVEMGPSPVSPQDNGVLIVQPAELPNGIGAIIVPGDSKSEFLKQATLFQKHFNTNLMTTKKEFQANWPKDSQLTLGGEWWNISFGRGPLGWGVGESGNLVIGSHIDSHNNLNISFFSSEFKLQFLYLFLPNPLNDEKEERTFMGSRLENQPYPWLRFAVTENVMFKGASIPRNYLDPTFIYHNLYNGDMLNAIASLEAQVALARGLSLHSQFVLDQFQFANEGGYEANALGFLVGMTHSAPVREGILTTSVEFVGTDPSLYRRDRVDFLVVRGLKNNGTPLAFDYLGYRWGSDSIVCSAEMTYLIPGKARYKASALLHRQGRVDIFGPHYYDTTSQIYDNSGNSNIAGPPLSGDAIKEQLIIALEGSWWLKKTPMRFFAELTWIGRRTYAKATKTTSGERSDLQLVTRMVFTF
ncbi:capsule assembly Wzi family protein [Sphaerochaeta sp. PS]|uniref:capsule assembly Wzi family protein n=1 Tax=Sphaerochaeta sp. PS TaxID=3076336 RepID=UPI0028A3A022|nr:hypothetical protein [Sphaerochaeta sp. PS]MDT4762513.1 hypothetical protein [Sphaerochaeta sp. PS]